jgi:HlyD family secretion protein
MRDEYQYYKQRLSATLESQALEKQMREKQLIQLEASIDNLQKNLEIARNNLDGLRVKAPINGQLTFLDAEVGENKVSGQRLGQVDKVGEYKVSAQIDEFYLSRIRKGQTGAFSLAGNEYTLVVTKVYPQVQNAQFKIDLKFEGARPDKVSRGQTVKINLQIGETSETLLLANGKFFDESLGKWVFVMDSSGSIARKRDVKLGRRNTSYIEVLDGLREGERVITSGYARLTEVDQVELNSQ